MLFRRICRSSLKLPRFCFSKNINSAQNSLKDAINSEIDFEKENSYNEDEDQYIKNFLAQNNWKIETTETNPLIKLSKKVEQYNISIHYEAKAVEEEQEQQEDQAEDGQQYQQEQEEESPHNNDFIVIVQNPKGKSLLLQMNAIQGELGVISIIFTDNAEDYVRDKLAFYKNGEYQGPSFETLDETVQDGVMKFLEALGVDDEIALFIKTSSQH